MATVAAFVILGAALTSPVRALDLALPDMGASSDAVMTPISEQRLGKAFIRSVRQSMRVLDEPLVTDYIQNLGRQLAAGTEGAGLSFTFFVVDDPLVNAFAGPGGYIGVYSGLILTAESESELAAVLAHEIAHVTQRHLMRSVEDQRLAWGPAAALLIAAAILGSQVSPDAGLAAALGAQAAVVQHQINFTRENEQEADRIGIAALAAAGYEPHAMPAFFERLSKSSRVYENNAPEFLRTHPVTTNRIADSLNRADRVGYRQRKDSLRYHLVRAYLREQSLRPPARAVEHFTGTLSEQRHTSEDGERYGLALALTHDGRFDKAREQAQLLLRSKPNEPAYVLLDAEIDLRSGRAADALRKLTPALRLQPSSYPLLMGQAEAAMAAGQPGEAITALDKAARQRPDDSHIQRLLSDAYGKRGDRFGAHRHLAEHLYLSGQLEPTIRQLEIALRQPDLSFYQSAELEARLSEVKAEFDALKKSDKSAGRR
jgi:predicted Zn-dependent protease